MLDSYARLRVRSLEDALNAINLFAHVKTREIELPLGSDTSTETQLLNSERQSLAPTTPAHSMEVRSEQQVFSASTKSTSNQGQSDDTEGDVGLISMINVSSDGDEDCTGGTGRSRRRSSRSTSHLLRARKTKSDAGPLSLRWGPVDGKDVILQRWTEAIGSGTAASVYRGRLFVCQASKDLDPSVEPANCNYITDVAVKVFRSLVTENMRVENVMAALKRRFQLNHPRISSVFFTVPFPSDPHAEKWLPDMSNARSLHLALAMEYANGGTVASHLRRREKLPEALVRVILRDILSAVQYLHQEMNIVHNDIKALNILVFHEGSGADEVVDQDSKSERGESSGAAYEKLITHDDKRTCYKLTDFGSARSIDIDAISPARLFHIREKILRGDTGKEELLGTATHMSPESCLGIDGSATSDIWSIGVTVFHMVTGCVPWQPLESAFPHIIINGFREKFSLGCLFRTEFSVPRKATRNGTNEPGSLDTDFSSFGPVLDEIDHPSYSPEIRDFVKQCLIEDPSKRPTCEQLLQHPFVRGEELRSSHS